MLTTNESDFQDKHDRRRNPCTGACWRRGLFPDSIWTCTDEHEFGSDEHEFGSDDHYCGDEHDFGSDDHYCTDDYDYGRDDHYCGDDYGFEQRPRRKFFRCENGIR